MNHTHVAARHRASRAPAVWIRFFARTTGSTRPRRERANHRDARAGNHSGTETETGADVGAGADAGMNPGTETETETGTGGGLQNGQAMGARRVTTTSSSRLRGTPTRGKSEKR